MVVSAPVWLSLLVCVFPCNGRFRPPIFEPSLYPVRCSFLTCSPFLVTCWCCRRACLALHLFCWRRGSLFSLHIQCPLVVRVLTGGGRCGLRPSTCGDASERLPPASFRAWALPHARHPPYWCWVAPLSPPFCSPFTWVRLAAVAAIWRVCWCVAPRLARRGLAAGLSSTSFLLFVRPVFAPGAAWRHDWQWQLFFAHSYSPTCLRLGLLDWSVCRAARRCGIGLFWLSSVPLSFRHAFCSGSFVCAFRCFSGGPHCPSACFCLLFFSAAL